MENNFDINFDFTSDTPYFWEMYWKNEMGGVSVDPDSKSKTLKMYHKLVWSKQLPNGEFMNLTESSDANYLTWKDFRFGSDSITASFRYESYKYTIKQVMDYLPDYKNFMEEYTRKTYTIGGSIIFPKMQGSINQARGCNPFIRDRFDLTLECIRRFYVNEKSPLSATLQRNKHFLDLFIDFKGYVEFFYLQDLVIDDYSDIKFWLTFDGFEKNPFPKNVDEYLLWINNQLEFVKKRNERIKSAVCT